MCKGVGAEVGVGGIQVVGCKGGRSVEGCGGFPYLKIKKLIGFLVFVCWLFVSWFWVSWLKHSFSHQKICLTYCKTSASCF